jgi:hypothetical protein
VVKATIEPKSLNQFLEALGQFAAGMKITMRDAMLEQAAMVCQDAAKFTPPLPPGGGKGLTAAAHKAGMRAVEGDIRKIFTAANDRGKKNVAGLVTNQLAFAAKGNDYAAFQTIMGGGKLSSLVGLSPIARKIAGDPNPERAFAKAKNYFNRANPVRNEYGTQGFTKNVRGIHNQVKGRFGGRIKKGQRVGTFKLLVEDKTDLEAYILQRQQAVGSVKSGWAAALRSLPPPTENNGQQGEFGAELRKAAWISGKVSVAGYNVSNFGSVLAQVGVTNTLGNVNNIADEAGVLGLVYANRIKQMPAAMRYRMQKRVDTFNKK